MAPLTRMRAKQPGNIPQELNATYYAQRATAGFILSEATQISQQGQGYPATPGIHSKEQIAGWQNVTKAVHDKGGKIFLCGNGGSAADAQHLAAEFLVRLRPKVNRKPIPAISLATITRCPFCNTCKK